MHQLVRLPPYGPGKPASRGKRLSAPPYPPAGDERRPDADVDVLVAAGPRVDARRRGGRALLLFLQVVRGALDKHGPAGTLGLVDLVDLEGDAVLRVGDPGAQVLVEGALAV